MARAWPVMRTNRDVCSLRSSDNVVSDAWLALLVTFAVSYYISLMWSTVVGLLLVASARTLLYFIRKCLSLVERCLALRTSAEVCNGLYAGFSDRACIRGKREWADIGEMADYPT